MKYFIGMEEVAASALIHSMRLWGKDFVPYGGIEGYGRAAQGVMCMDHRGTSLIVMPSRAGADGALSRCGGYFTEDEAGGRKGLRARGGVTEKELAEKFQAPLAPDVLLALNDERAVRALAPCEQGACEKNQRKPRKKRKPPLTAKREVFYCEGVSSQTEIWNNDLRRVSQGRKKHSGGMGS